MLFNNEADFYLISIKYLKFQAEMFCEREGGREGGWHLSTEE